MAVTELFCEPELLDSVAGRSQLLDVLRRLRGAIAMDAPVELSEGWLLIAAEPLVVFRALRGIEPHWTRIFTLFPPSAHRGTEIASAQT